MGFGRREGVDYAAHGADEVEVDDGTPREAFLAESIGCIRQLELCAGVRRR